MLRRVTKLHGSHVLALDGEVGKVRDVYFDDVSWIVRYLIVDTGGWLSGRKVLISPRAVGHIDRASRTVSLSLTRERIEASPNIDADKPVSRLHESEIHSHYGYPAYWAGTQWGTGPMPPAAAPIASDLLELQERRLADEPPGDTHLRSTRELLGYSVTAAGAELGRVRNFLVDDETWAIRELILDRGIWPFGQQVLISRRRVQRLDWAAKSIEVAPKRKRVPRAAASAADGHAAEDSGRGLDSSSGSHRSRH